MRLRFWRRDPLPDLTVDKSADIGAVPIDRGVPVQSNADAPSGYTAGAVLITEDLAGALHSEYFRPEQRHAD
jgi:hypothetical protein